MYYLRHIVSFFFLVNIPRKNSSLLLQLPEDRCLFSIYSNDWQTVAVTATVTGSVSNCGVTTSRTTYILNFLFVHPTAVMQLFSWLRNSAPGMERTP